MREKEKLAKELVRLKDSVKLRDFKELVKYWQETFELFYKEFGSNGLTEGQKVWKACSLIESVKAEQLALWVLFHDDEPLSRLIKEEYAVYILLSRIFVDNSNWITKEEFFDLLNEI